MAGWTLNDIIQKVRGTTGRPDASMMSNATIIDYINKYYQYVMPKELKIFWGYTYHQFYTQANVDQYIAPANFQTLNPTAYADGFPLEWYLSPDVFFSDYPQQENKVVVGNGNGSLNSFTFQIPAFPVLARSVYVTDGTQIAQDNGTGGFTTPTGISLGGTINYATGSVVGLSFLAPPAANTNITCASQTYMANRPQGILFYKTRTLIDATVAARDLVNMFVIRPVPDQVYLIKMQGIQIPPELINLTDVPFRPDLGPLIAYGASLEIFADFNQMDQYDQTLTQFNRYKDVSMQDTYEELIYTRSVPAF
jgi:hypothetical protein